MAMDATIQIRMDSKMKNQVEELYRSLGTSFTDAVRIFAQQSLYEGGMPFRPHIKGWDEMTPAEIDEKLAQGMADIAAGRVVSQDAMDARMKERLTHGRASQI